MKKFTLFVLLATFARLNSFSQTVLYLETFSTSLNTCTATAGSNGNWAWSSSCALSTSGGHTAPGHAVYQGSGCQFGNGSSTTSGDLITPAIPLGALGATLSFNYYINNECSSFGSTCTYDVLKMAISTNGGISYTDVFSSNTTPGGLATNNAGWATATLNLSSYLNQTITIKFDFNSVDGIGNAYDGIYVDDIHVVGACSINAFATNGTSTISPAICSGGSITLSTNAGSNYNWSTGGTTQSIVVSPTVTTQYSIAATSTLLCNSNAVVTVSVSGGIPTLAVNASTNNVCLGKTVTLTATGANTYAWTGGVSNGVGFVPTSSSTYTVTGTNGCGTSTSAISLTVAPLPVAVVVTPSQVCAGQNATISVAAAATSYSWQPVNSVVSVPFLVVSPQVNTTYTVAAGDGTCSGVATISLATVPVPTISVVLSNTTVCQGDPVVITASGGLNYTWTPGNLSGAQVTVNPTSPTAYSVAGDNSFGCASGANAVVITNPTPNLNLNVSDNFICSGESVTVTVSGASSYLWTNNATSSVVVEAPAATTVYGVTGTDNGCSSTQTVQVDVFTPAVSVSGSTAVCLGNTTTLTASGASSYTWEPGTVPSAILNANPTANTVYTLSTLTATNNVNCAATQTVLVLINPNPTVSAVADRTLICRNETATVTASGASSYLWFNGSTANSIVVTSSLVTVLNVSVTGTGANGCRGSKLTNLTVSACNSVNELEAANYHLTVYPNPNTGDFTLEINSVCKVEIVNELGQVVRTFETNPDLGHGAEVRGLAPGMYFVKVNGLQQVSGYKIIVSK